MNASLTFPLEWGALHVLVIHFPIAILCVVPLFIILGLFLKNRTFLLAALLLLILGILSIFLAVSTGESSSERIQEGPAIIETLNRHDALAWQSRTFFSVMTLLYATLFFWESRRLSKINRQLPRILFVCFLLFYGYGLWLIFKTAYYGAMLVHRHGVHSSLHEIFLIPSGQK